MKQAQLSGSARRSVHGGVYTTVCIRRETDVAGWGGGGECTRYRGGKVHEDTALVLGGTTCCADCFTRFAPQRAGKAAFTYYYYGACFYVLANFRPR